MTEQVALLGMVLTFDLGALIWLTGANLVFTCGWALWIARDTPWRARILMSVGLMTLCTVVGFTVLSWAIGVPVRDIQLIVLGGYPP